MHNSLRKSIVSSLEEACFCLENENNWLLNGDLDEVVKNFPVKKKVINLLEDNFALIKENNVVDGDNIDYFKELFDKFNALAEKNRILLESVIETQNKVLKILLLPEEEESRKGYNLLGEYNKVSNIHQALAVKSDI